MAKDTVNLEVLATRAGFNSAVRYMNKTIDISGTLKSNINLGDLLYERADENLSGERSALLLQMILVDKLGYASASANLESIAADVPSLAQEFSSWKGVDLIAAYHHPDLGLLVANPKIAEELQNFGMLRRHELIVIYAGKGESPTDESCKKAAHLALELFEGKKPKAPADLLKGNFTAKKLAKPVVKEAAPKAAKATSAKAPPPAAKGSAARAAPPVITTVAPAVTTGGPVRMTPMYSVVVSNELFHNGNVEAWKRIIDSYNAKHPELQVFIYYEGERILDINTLFKWGKVKHGSAIMFAVSGNDIKDVAKLQRYLVQGASSQFEAFLQGSVGSSLRLFG
ncbi:MAG: hypothetical protein FWH12_06670 [Treponema sp.]|nr:hypothetical protein [Treponema sp.]